jgi:hypothetical protein
MRYLLALLGALVVVPSAAATFAIAVTTPSPLAAPGVTLNGVDQAKSFPVVINVQNTNPGSTTGWNVTASSTTPTFGSYTLPELAVTDVSSTSCSGGGCSEPVNSVVWPVVLDTTSQRIFNAAAGTGAKGSVDLTATFRIAYPAGIPAGTYSATVTISGTRSP